MLKNTDDYIAMVDDLIEHEALKNTKRSALLSEEDNIPEERLSDQSSFVNWIEENKPEYLSVKYKKASDIFLQRIVEEFKMKIIISVENVFLAPSGDHEMTKRQVHELQDIGFVAIDKLSGKTSSSQIFFIIEYWKALKEYMDMVALNFYDTFAEHDVNEISSMSFLDGFESSEYSLKAYFKADGTIRCHACSYEGKPKKQWFKNIFSCPVCHAPVKKIN